MVSLQAHEVTGEVILALICSLCVILELHWIPLNDASFVPAEGQNYFLVVFLPALGFILLRALNPTTREGVEESFQS